MDINNIPPEDLEWMRKNGIDPSTVEEAPTNNLTPTGMSPIGAVGATLKGHAGSLVGGGAAGLAGWAGGAALAPETGGLSLAIPLVASILAGSAGSYGGEKAQKAILPKEIEDALEAKAQEAQATHPLVSAGTDIAASALTSGGKFSPSTGLKGLKGLKLKL